MIESYVTNVMVYVGLKCGLIEMLKDMLKNFKNFFLCRF